MPAVQIGLIVINDNSTTDISDAIVTITSAVPFFLYHAHTPNSGKGFTLRAGVSRSTAEICIYTDIDFPYTTQSILRICDALAENKTQIAAGVKDADYYSHVPAVRRFISKLLQSMIRLFLALEISDTQCGLKGFNATGKQVFLQTTINRYLFDLEFIFLASRNKQLHITPVEIQLRNDVTFRKMNWKILVNESANFCKIVLKRFMK